MHTYCKSLHPGDYEPLSAYVNLFERMAKRVPCSIEHYHRRWETSIAQAAIDETSKGRGTILEVGSGGSLFAPLAASYGYQVTVCDPAERVQMATRQAQKLMQPIEVVQSDFMDTDLGTFDYVVCLSVIEHVKEDAPFWSKLLESARKGVVLTADFSPDGGVYSPHHRRTYSPATLEAMCSATGWEPLGEPLYDDNGPQVFDYSFASVALVRAS